jgi:hypothetical protein
MTLVVHRLEALPPLAWCARVEPSGVDLWCGAWVETGDDFFWEGAWAGEFAAGGFARCPDRMGSGGRVTAAGLQLVPPSHALERINLVRTEGRAFASNSLPFALAAAGVELDPRYPFHRDDLWSVVRGARKCAHRLRARGATVELLRVDPVLLGPDLRARTLGVPAPDWRTYEEYRASVTGTIRALVDNAGDVARRARFEPVATLSRGYDSPASAALASEAGCADALTFREGCAYMADGAVHDDSGAEIGRVLGLRVREVAYDRAEVPEETAAEIAAGGDAFDLKLTALEPHVKGRLLFTGVRGGAAWDVDPARPFDPVACMDPSGTSLGEWRVRTGFVHVAPPVIGVSARKRLHAITRSDEMRKWVLGGDYDRPVPRRILEEKGVPREAFGQVKLGSFDVIQFERDDPTPWPGFEALAPEHGSALGTAGRLRLRVRHRVARRLATLAPALRSRYDVPWPGRSAAVVPWGVAVLRERYRHALGRGRES